jgi:hypothetical protein
MKPMKNSASPLQPRSREAVCAFVPRELKRELEQRARAEDRSVSSVVRLALTEHLRDGRDLEPVKP